MFNLTIEGDPIASGILVSSSESIDRVFAQCAYDSSMDGQTSISGLEIGQLTTSGSGRSFEVSNLHVVSAIVSSAPWKEIHRWLGWTDNEGILHILHKYITQKEFSSSTISNLINFDLNKIDIVGDHKELSASIRIYECTKVLDLFEYLKTSIVEEMYSELR